MQTDLRIREMDKGLSCFAHYLLVFDRCGPVICNSARGLAQVFLTVPRHSGGTLSYCLCSIGAALLFVIVHVVLPRFS